MSRTLVVSLVIAQVLTGCGGDDTLQANLADVPTGPPLTGLPPCGEPPEPLVTDGEYRTFVTAGAICDRASVVVGAQGSGNVRSE